MIFQCCCVYDTVDKKRLSVKKWQERLGFSEKKDERGFKSEIVFSSHFYADIYSKIWTKFTAKQILKF